MIRSFSSFRAAALLLAAVAVAVAGSWHARRAGAADTQLRSDWARTPVTVDGSAAEWKGNLTYVKELKSYIGIRNDAQSLYLCIQAADSQATRQEIGSGLLVSLEPEGGKSRRLAIRYPAGFFGQGAREPGEEGGPPPEGAAPGRERWNREDLMNRSLGQVEILGPAKDDRNILAVRELREAAVAYGSAGGIGVYEARFALRSTPQNSFALDAGAGKAVKLEIESGRRGGGAGRGPGGRRGGGWGDRGGGGRGGGGGGRHPGEGGDGGWERPPGEDGGTGGGGGGGRPPGGRFRHAEPIHGSIKFQLAPAPSGAGGR